MTTSTIDLSGDPTRKRRERRVRVIFQAAAAIADLAGQRHAAQGDLTQIVSETTNQVGDGQIHIELVDRQVAARVAVNLKSGDSQRRHPANLHGFHTRFQAVPRQGVAEPIVSECGLIAQLGNPILRDSRWHW